MHLELSDSLLHALRVGLLVAAFIAFAWALVSSRRQAEQANAKLGAHLEAALGEIRRLSGQVAVVSVAIDSIGTRLAQTTARPAPPSVAAVNTRGYESAIRMARGGASIDEIVASCGTTRAEAKLLRRLHECGEPRRANAEGVRIA
jgi:hypothetical protein